MKSFLSKLQSDKSISPFSDNAEDALMKMDQLGATYLDDAEDYHRIRKSFRIVYYLIIQFKSFLKQKSINLFISTEDIPFLIAFMNHQYFVLQSKIQERKCQVVSSPQMNTSVEDIRVKNSIGSLSVDEANTIFVDTFAYLVSHLHTSQGNNSINIEQEYITLEKKFLIAQYDALLKEMWQCCLWGDGMLKIDKNEMNIVLDQITKSRRSYLLGGRAHKAWLALVIVHPERIQNAKIMNLIYSLQFDSNHGLIMLNNSCVAKEYLSMCFADLLSNTYYKYIAETFFTYNTSKICFIDILRMYICLHKIVSAYSSRIQLSPYEKCEEIINKYLIKISRKNIISIFSKIYKDTYTNQIMDDLLIFLTFSNSTPDIWAFPLLIHDDFCTFLISSIETSDPLRVFESWVRKSNIQIDNKGHQYEKEIRDNIQTTLSKNPIMANSFVGNITREEVGEEIDLLFTIGSTVFVVEMKCNYIFSTQRAYHSYEKDIKHATLQASRKVICVQNKIRRIATKIGLKQPDKVKVIPLVLSNLPYMSTDIINDVQITDVESLLLYLSGSISKIHTIVSAAGVEKREAVSQKLYNNQKEAAEQLIPFLKESPIITRFNIEEHEIQRIPVIDNKEGYNHIVIYDYILSDTIFD